MTLNGKKSQRVMMRVSEEMWQQIDALSELECRTKQDTCRWLIAIALSQVLAAGGKRTREEERQQLSLPTFAETEAKATPHRAVNNRQQNRRFA